MRTPIVPSGAEVVRTYEEYGQFVDGFFQRHFQLLMVIGRPGIGKSYEFETQLDLRSHLIKGWVAPLKAFIDAYRHRNKLLIFDDAEVLWKRQGGRVLLRSLCEHRAKKTIQWTSTTKDLAKARVPQKFTTTSRVAIIANRFAFGNEEEQAAVLDRGHLVYFDPTALEVHKRVGDWFWDQQVYDHIGERLHLFNEITARVYVKAWERKQANGDWATMIEQSFCHDKAKLLVQELEVDPQQETVEQRVAEFVARTSFSRASYFNFKRALKKDDQLTPLDRIDVPDRQLRGTPPNLEDESEDLAPEWETADDQDGTIDGHRDPADWWKLPIPTDAESLEKGTRGDEDRRDWLHRELVRAIEREDYERAAELRDAIRRMEEGGP